MDKNKLLEAQSSLHIYMDDATGDYYIYNGKEYVKIGNKPVAKPEIGKQGNKEFQDREAEERKQQIQKEREEAQKAKDAGEEYDEDALKDEETDEERAQRIKDIQSLFDDEQTREEATQETNRKVDRELARKKVGAVQNYGSPIQRFEMSLEKFVKSQIRERRTSSWSRPNMSYEGTGIIRQGKRNEQSKEIPKINVYFDQSGSWGADAIKAGEDAIGVLNNYVRRKEIKIDVFYFANTIDTKSRAEGGNLGGGGTGAGPEILEHIRSTRPDNVIIMTDDDISLEGNAYYPHRYDRNFDGDRMSDPIPCTPVKVPGARWLLYRGHNNPDLEKYIKGRKLNQEFML